MEEKYKQVTDIIKSLAEANPYITKEQIAKAKSMYNGDERPIEVIQAELEAYSAQIEEQGKSREEKREFHKEEKKEIHNNPISEPTQPEQEYKSVPEENLFSESLVAPKQEPEIEIYEPLKAELPGEDKRRELQSMIDDALGGTSVQAESNINLEATNTNKKDQGKVLTKTQEAQNSSEGNSSSSNDSGYGNVPALLTLTIMFSIVTIIMAFFTIISN